MKNGRFLLALIAAFVLVACGDSPSEPEVQGFLAGAPEDPQIGIVVNSSANSLTLFHRADPSERRTISFGSGEDITPTGLSVRGTRALVPLGNAATTALVDLEAQELVDFFPFEAGNATGSAWVDDNSALVTNLNEHYVARIQLDADHGIIAATAEVHRSPTLVLVHGGRALVVSSGYDVETRTHAAGRVTALDPETLEVLGSVETGINPQGAAIAPDGDLYLVNTGNYVDPSSIMVIDPETLEIRETIGDLPAGTGGLRIDESGLALLSSWSHGTFVFDTGTHAWVRGPGEALCAPLEEQECAGASGAAFDADGNVYQVFFGAPWNDILPAVFVYSADSYELTERLTVAEGFHGPTSIEIRSFR